MYIQTYIVDTQVPIPSKMMDIAPHYLCLSLHE
jgi:hypothetical protein